MKVYWTEVAISDLRAIRSYISEHSQRYANSMVARIIDRTAALPSQPLVGSVVQEYSKLPLRELFEHPYRVIYQVFDDRIEIVTIVHAARQLPPEAPRAQ